MGKRTGVLLTKRVVDAAAPGPARFDMWDTKSCRVWTARGEERHENIYSPLSR